MTAIIFYDLPRFSTPTFQQDGVTITGSGNVVGGSTDLGGGVRSGSDLGINNGAIDPGEFIEFSFDAGAASGVSYVFGGAGNTDGDNLVGEGNLEAFDVNGNSLGVLSSDARNGNISSLFGNQLISRFRLTQIEGLSIGSLTFTSVPVVLQAETDTVTTSEDDPITFNVRTNDTLSPSGLSPTLSFNTAGLQGSLTNNGNGSFTYSPDPAFQSLNTGQTATTSFQYTLTSGSRSSTATVTLTITGITDNRPPTAVNFINTTTTLDENTSTATRIKVADVTVTDDGLGTNNLSLSNTNAFELDGSVLYLKAGTVLDFETQTSYSVTVNADDPTVGTTTPDASRNFILTVRDLVENQPPTAVNDSATVTEGQTVTIAVLSNDTDPENNTLSIDSFTAPTNGTVTQNPNGTLSYKANLNFSGTDTFTYIAKDSNGAKSRPATVSVSVTPLNLTGTFGSDILTGTSTNNSILGLAGNDTINSGAGDDTLTGGFGADRFVFASGRPFATADFGVDFVVDWVRATGDKIVLSKTSFTALTSPVGNGLAASDFAAVALPGAGAAGASSARIVFSQFTGELYYNENGSAPGLGSGGLFARIPSAISQLNRNGFVVIA